MYIRHSYCLKGTSLRQSVYMAGKAKNGAKRPPRAQPRRPAPAPAPKRAPRKPRRPKVQAGHSSTIMNPLDPRPVPSPNFEGKAFVATDMYRYPINIQAGALILATNVGDCGTVMSVVNMASGTVGIYTLPTLAAGPTAGRAMKASLSLVNTTPNITRGGSVWQANLNQRLELPAAPSTMSTAQWQAVIDEVTNHPDTIQCTAHDFARNSAGLVAYPSDSTAYHSYRDWKNTITLDGYFEYVATWNESQYRARPMSTLVYVIGPQTDANSYTVTVRATNYTRWPVDTVPGRQSQLVPTADPGKIARLHAGAWVAAQTVLAGAAVAGAAAARAMATRAGEMAGAAAAEPLLVPLLAL